MTEELIVGYNAAYCNDCSCIFGHDGPTCEGCGYYRCPDCGSYETNPRDTIAAPPSFERDFGPPPEECPECGGMHYDETP